MFSGTQDKCATCNKTVYPIEKVNTTLNTFTVKLRAFYSKELRDLSTQSVLISSCSVLTTGDCGEPVLP